MILGLSTANFTLLHVIISLVAIVSGLVVLFGMLGSHRMAGWTLFFLVTTILTSVTGFFFPIHGFTPALGVGAVSLVILLIALVALYGKHLTGAWRWIYVVTAVTVLYFNALVLIVQAFQKISFLNPLAPQVGLPFPERQNTHFAIAQVVAMAFFVVLGILAALRFRPGPAISGQRAANENSRRCRRLSQTSPRVDYLSWVETLVNFALSLLPSVLTMPMMATAMPAAIKPYSMAVAPDSSFRNAMTFDT